MYNLKKNEKGLVMVWVAILLPVLLLFAALTLDMGRAMMIAGMFQDALDAAAWAAVVPSPSEIFVEPSPTPVGQEPTYVVRLKLSQATSRAQRVFASNWGPTPGITVNLLTPNRVRVNTAITIPTFLVGELFGEIRVERNAEAQSVTW